MTIIFITKAPHKVSSKINFDVFYQSYLKIFLSHKICIPFLSVTFMIKARIFLPKGDAIKKLY